MIDPIWWLGQWESIEAPGRHSSVAPADGAMGYPPFYHGQVIRAIPIDGVVGDRRPSWANSPQVRFWLEPKRLGLWARFRKWLMSPCRKEVRG